MSIGIDKGEGEEASRERNQGEADQRRRFDGDGGARDGDGDGGREELGFGKGVSLERRGEDEQMDKYARAEQGWPARGTRLAGGGGDTCGAEQSRGKEKGRLTGGPRRGK